MGGEVVPSVVSQHVARGSVTHSTFARRERWSADTIVQSTFPILPAQMAVAFQIVRRTQLAHRFGRIKT
jgi:hypothetical protein